MSNSRDAILARLSNAKPQAKDKETIAYQPYVSDDEQLNRQRFIDGLTASHAEIISTQGELLKLTIQQTIINKKITHIALGTAGEFHTDIINATHDIQTMHFDSDFDNYKSQLFNIIDAGITHCRAGIADTGTLVLWPDIAEPRTLSLVPPCHIAIIKRSTIKSNFAELMITQAWQHNMPTNVVLISGPSKTADIQQTLAYGAHGPSQLVVILIEDM